MNSIKPEIMAVMDAMLSNEELKSRLLKAVKIIEIEYDNMQDIKYKELDEYKKYLIENIGILGIGMKKYFRFNTFVEDIHTIFVPFAKITKALGVKFELYEMSKEDKQDLRNHGCFNNGDCENCDMCTYSPYPFY